MRHAGRRRSRHRRGDRRLGCPLFIDEQPWGLLTLDSLDPARFAQSDLDNLETFARLAAASVRASDRLLNLSQRADAEHQLAERYRAMAGQTAPAELIGQSSAFKRLLREIDTVASSDLTVLIGGETGVGKELVATLKCAWDTADSAAPQCSSANSSV